MHQDGERCAQNAPRPGVRRCDRAFGGKKVRETAIGSSLRQGVNSQTSCLSAHRPTQMVGMRHQTQSVCQGLCDWRLRGPTSAHDYFSIAPNFWIWVDCRFFAPEWCEHCVEIRPDRRQARLASVQKSDYWRNAGIVDVFSESASSSEIVRHRIASADRRPGSARRPSSAARCARHSRQ